MQLYFNIKSTFINELDRHDIYLAMTPYQITEIYYPPPKGESEASE